MKYIVGLFSLKSDISSTFNHVELKIVLLPNNKIDVISEFKQVDHWRIRSHLLASKSVYYEYPCGPDWQITMQLHIYGPRWFQWSWFGVNLTGGAVVAEFQHLMVWKELIVSVGMPMRPWWANDHDVAHPESRRVPINLIWSESAKWLLSSAIHKVPRALILPVVWHTHVAPMGKWLGRRTSTGQDGSNDLNLEWIIPAITELWHLQSLGRTVGHMSWGMNGQRHKIW